MKRCIKKILIAIIFSFGFSFCVLALEAPVDITKMSISDFQLAFEKGYLTSERLVKLYLERIEKYDGEFNTINQINDKALDQAIALDQERAKGNVRGSLHGIPILIKTNINYIGLATTGGAKALQNNYPIENATVVQKLIDAGAIILGSTNMSEFAFSAYNSNSSYGSVKNAFNLTYSPYGSSGGSAVAVALSFSAAALGTDTNSSIRVPASAASLVGIRSTIGLVSRYGIIPYDIERDTVGPLTKNVEDNAIIMQVIAGIDSKDTATENTTPEDYVTAFKNSSFKGVKIGVINNYYQGIEGASLAENKIPNSEVKLMMDKSLELMKEAGAKIVFVDKLITPYYKSIATDTYAGITFCDKFNKYLETTTGDIRNFNQLVSSSEKIYDLSGYENGCGGQYAPKVEHDSLKKIYADYVAKIMLDNDLDVIVYPTTKNRGLKLSDYDGLSSPGSSLGSIINYPSITLPMGFDSLGLAYGIEFMTVTNNESNLYTVAAEYEKINQNTLVNSKLAPNLYQISASVDTLKKIYEDPSYYDYSHVSSALKKDIVKLQNDTYNYFRSYSSNKNKDADAQKLIMRYSEILDRKGSLIKRLAKVFDNQKLRTKFYQSLWITIFVLAMFSWHKKGLKYHYKKTNKRKQKTFKKHK